jgi:hypothetical protein
MPAKITQVSFWPGTAPALPYSKRRDRSWSIQSTEMSRRRVLAVGGVSAGAARLAQQRSTF